MTKNSSSNRAVVPEAKGALDRFKFEVANELGVPLTDGYNGNLTSKQNGSVGGYMVKKMIEAQERQMAEKTVSKQAMYKRKIHVFSGTHNGCPFVCSINSSFQSVLP